MQSVTTNVVGIYNGPKNEKKKYYFIVWFGPILKLHLLVNCKVDIYLKIISINASDFMEITCISTYAIVASNHYALRGTSIPGEVNGIQHYVIKFTVKNGSSVVFFFLC